MARLVHASASSGVNIIRWSKLSLLSLALACLAHGLYIPFKAKVAQWLIEASWVDRSPNHPPAPPWAWADTRALARLEVPRLDIKQFVMDSASGQALAFGPGHLPGTAQPAQMGHSIIAGHRDTHFSFLQRLELGDSIMLEDHRGRTAEYRIEQLTVIDSSSEEIPMYADDLLTLVTCYPFDQISAGGSLRYLVHAVKLGM